MVRFRNKIIIEVVYSDKWNPMVHVVSTGFEPILQVMILTNDNPSIKPKFELPNSIAIIMSINLLKI